MRCELRRAWNRMKNRCASTHGRNYKNYTQRGISICSDWKEDFLTFKEWAIAKGYERGLWLDRKDNNNGYEPSNCHWVTPVQSARNTRAVRLTPKNIFAIRILSKRGMNNAALALNYGVCEGHIRAILNDRRWRKVSMENKS